MITTSDIVYVIALVSLAVLLAVKIVVSVDDRPRSVLINRHINVAIAPLLGIFAFIATIEVLKILGAITG